MNLSPFLLAALLQAAADELPRPAPGWKVSLVARAPEVRFPSAVCCAPDGRIFVAEDHMDQTGPVDRPVDRVVCIHPDGRVTVFADGLYAAFGLAYLEGRLYVQNAPRLTVFRDGGDQGLDRRELLECTLPRPWEPNAMNEHVPANLRLGMDGRFYSTSGSKGLFGVTGSDGRPFQMRMGGVWTFRPDGSALETFGEGTRNMLDVALNEHDDPFIADNNCHMAVWPSGLYHVRDGAYYGYPYHFKPLRPPAQPPIADLGYGACTGLLACTEGALPADFDNDLILADWGRSELVRLRMVRKGSTWDLAGREAILSRGREFRPIALDAAPDGLGFVVADWNHPGGRSKKEVGRVLKVEWTGASRAQPPPAWYLRAAAGKDPEAPREELLAALGHGDRRIRLAAQRALGRQSEAASALQAVLADARQPSRARRHALWALHESGTVPLAALADADAGLRAQAARSFGLRPSPAALAPLRGLLRDPEGSVRLQAVTALGRAGDPEAVAPLIELLNDPEAFLVSAAVSALRRIGLARPRVWTPLAAALGHPLPAVARQIALVFDDLADPDAVKALADPALPASARAEALRILAGQHRRAPPWDGVWWRRGPHGWTEDDRTHEARIEKTELWEGSPLVVGALRSGLGSADPATRRWAAEGLGRVGETPAIPDLRSLLASDADASVRGAALRALSLLKDVRGIAGILENPARHPELLREAAEAAVRIDAAEFGAPLAALLAGSLPPADLSAVIDALGSLNVTDAVPGIARQLGHAQPGPALAAVRALGRLGAAAELVRALESDRGELRRAAIRALGPLRSRAAVPALVKAWGDPETEEDAQEALTLVPDPRARDVYTAGLQARSTNVRGRCRAALKEIGVTPAAAAARPDREAYVRYATDHRGDAGRGKDLFHGAKGAACVKCHRAGGLPGGDVGPDLSGVGGKYARAVLLESLLYPSRQIADGFRQTLLSTRSGALLAGAVRGEDARELTLVDAEGRRLKLRKADIVERKESELSLMPEGIEAGLSLEELADLVAYLESLKDAGPR